MTATVSRRRRLTPTGRRPASVVLLAMALSALMAVMAMALTATVTSATLREVVASDAPVKVEVLTAAHLKRNATTNLMDNLSFVNGLNQQVDCGVCFTNNIRINGMEGPYTAVLIDGAPIMSALASVYGLNGIDPALVEQVEIIKGPSSTLHGSEAMGGLINVVTKDPRFAPRWSVSAATSSHGEHTLAVAGAPSIGGARGLLSVSTAYNDRFVDGNADGFSDLPLVRRLSVFNKWASGDASRRTLDIAGRLYLEDRFGGVRAWTPADRGTDRAYGESIRTRRMELVGSYRFPSLGDRLRVDAALNRHDQDSWYGLQPYLATQTTAFAQLTGRPDVGDRHDVALGVALRDAIIAPHDPFGPDFDPARVYGPLQLRSTTGRLPQAMDSFMPLVSGPQAVIWAERIASASLAAEATAQFRPPANSTQARHSTTCERIVDQASTPTSVTRATTVMIVLRDIAWARDGECVGRRRPELPASPGDADAP